MNWKKIVLIVFVCGSLSLLYVFCLYLDANRFGTGTVITSAHFKAISVNTIAWSLFSTFLYACLKKPVTESKFCFISVIFFLLYIVWQLTVIYLDHIAMSFFLGQRLDSWVRIEPDLAKDLMMNRGVTGTHDWQKYEIELEYDLAKVERVLFGGWLQGEGTAWFDNFEISFDGKVLKDNKNDVFNNYLNKNKKPPKRW